MTTTTDRTSRYLDDLARLLDSLEPAERAEVLDSVREHIDTSLADLEGEPNEADVDRILSELGAPGAVAEAALADRSTSGAEYTGPDRPAPKRPALSRGWVPPVALLGIVLGALGAPLIVPVVALIAGIVLLCLSPLWQPGQKALGAIGIPLGLVPVLLALLIVTWASGGPDAGLNAWAVIVPAGAVLALAIAGYLLVVGVRRASRWELPTT
ncbi:DUF1700 domain-containing protein [Ruania halotolerans]|uniref:DUF1700 domain-containing protein n=1 Tax=Ruania halotolerans TaxID=2897773 RepID=UPI001E601DE2|nr:hypothetical protein [Ruania halotolerans]UFU05696.1 hypothetical protein LQF10_14795 [Ruania halotolerans]